MAANDVSFRPATRADARVIAELFQISSEGVADYVWNQLEGPEFEGLELIEIGTKRYGREDVKFSYQNCDIAEIDGETVGMLHAYVIGDDVGNVPDDIDPVLRPYAELEEPHSLNISGLALFDKFRGTPISVRVPKVLKRSASSASSRTKPHAAYTSVKASKSVNAPQSSHTHSSSTAATLC